ncbi:hypothetical protein FH063_004720 [Azospirillum argentinense]|uniref:Uncharacterized protein n=1 Tax=Azospirillum argentinense TaxID=2970906 RepID=A0A5B0KVE0_9PROT|nr:hypothetical protein FH063_004720 [Azospirillum argentinense]
MAIAPKTTIVFAIKMMMYLYWDFSIGFLRLCIMFIASREPNVIWNARSPNVRNFS